jgi:hypothetical protein
MGLVAHPYVRYVYQYGKTADEKQLALLDFIRTKLKVSAWS